MDDKNLERVRKISVREASTSLMDTGLLYLINQVILHRVGLALAFIYDSADGPSTGVEFITSLDGGPLTFDPSTKSAGREKLIKWLGAEGWQPSTSELGFASQLAEFEVEDVALAFLRSLGKEARVSSPEQSEDDMMAERMKTERYRVKSAFFDLREQAKRKADQHQKRTYDEITRWLVTTVIPMLSDAVVVHGQGSVIVESHFRPSDVLECLQLLGCHRNAVTVRKIEDSNRMEFVLVV